MGTASEMQLSNGSSRREDANHDPRANNVKAPTDSLDRLW